MKCCPQHLKEVKGCYQLANFEYFSLIIGGGLSFQNVFYWPLSRWICEANPTHLENIPSGMSGDYLDSKKGEMIE